MARLFFADMTTLRRLIAIAAITLIVTAVLALNHSARAQDVERGGPMRRATREAATRADRPTPVPGATPTIDRLAAPPTVPSPTQPDDGAQLYWLHCQPCHGDVGQGLTEEWRMQYPPEDRNCWDSGCHGERPYDDGFTIPREIPAVIGEGTLSRFPTVRSLYEYNRVAMPHWRPGYLEDDVYLAITAFLARENGVWAGVELTVEESDVLLLGADALPGESIAADPVATAPAAETAASPTAGGVLLWTGILATLIILGGGLILWLRRNR